MTLIDLKLDENHDLMLDGSDLATTDEDTALTQRLTIRLNFFYQEWFLDRTKGIPYTQVIFEAGTDINQVYALIRKEIKDTKGVEKINSLEITPDTQNRSLSIAFSVNDNTEITIVEVTI